jgi:hypothetical protein
MSEEAVGDVDESWGEGWDSCFVLVGALANGLFFSSQQIRVYRPEKRV